MGIFPYVELQNREPTYYFLLGEVSETNFGNHQLSTSIWMWFHPRIIKRLGLALV